MIKAINSLIKNRSLPLLSLLFLTILCRSQLYFNFEDSTLAGWEQNPDSVWAASAIDPISGNYSLHHIYDHPSAGHDQITHPLTFLDVTADTTRWRFSIRHSTNPSGYNNWAVYLFSDMPSEYMYPTGNASGYAVGVDFSGTDDTIRLWKISSGSASVINSTGINWETQIGVVNHAAIEIIRDPGGNWQILLDTTGTFNHLYSVGTANDISYLDAQYFGIYYKYSSAQDQKLWVDDIIINGAFIIDTLPPEIDTVKITSDHQLRILFNEAIPDSFLLDTGNYYVNQDVGHPDTIYKETTKSALLNFPVSFKDEVWHGISIFNPVDNYENRADTLVYSFFYYKVKPDYIVINEIMADPEPLVGLPEYEYIELLNISNYPVPFAGWKLIAGSKMVSLPSITLQPDSFLIICHKEAVSEFQPYGLVAGLFTSQTTLTNSGQTIVLKDENDSLINQVEYDISWYNDVEKENGGWSLEKIDPENNCSGITNWKASIASAGGTPGAINSVNAPNRDTLAPCILSAEVISSRILKLNFSEEVVEAGALKPENYSINMIGIPDSIHLGSKGAELFFTTSFTSGVTYMLLVSGIYDDCGNIQDHDTIRFLYYIAQSNDVVINEIMADPEPVVGLPEYEYMELFNRSDYPVSLNEWTLTAGSKIVYLPSLLLQPDSFLILCHYEAEEVMSNFGHATGVLTSHTALANSGLEITLRDNRDSIINQLTYSINWYQENNKEEGGWSLERMDPENHCGKLSNWRASIDPNGGTPGKVNSVYVSNLDTIPPQVESVEILFGTTIRVSISEFDEVYGLLNPNHYFVNEGIGYPDSVHISESSVLLFFSNPLKIGVKYTLIINGLSDECGNMMEQDSISFEYRLPAPYDILITEIMADTDPVAGLPDAEYLELYHAGIYPIHLSGWKIWIGNVYKSIPPYILDPGRYLTLCDAGDSSLFNSFTSVLGINNFPALPNSGQRVVLCDPLGRVIHTINYSLTWYGTEYKAEGGWSLEMIDPDNPCGEADNWAECIDKKGGTPGQENSVKALNPDINYPLLERAVIKQDTILFIHFSETTDSSSIMNEEVFSVDHNIGNPHCIDPVGPDYTSVCLFFTGSFQQGNVYTLSVEGALSDCAGNRITDRQEVRFAIPDSIKPSDIIINEILFNPRNDGVDFVEIYNNTEGIYDISQLVIGKTDEQTGEYLDTFVVSPDNYLLFPGEYIALTENPDKVLEQYYTPNPSGFIRIQGIPDFNNDQDEVVLLNRELEVIDAFAYREDMHYPLLTDPEGVSLERIYFKKPANDATNWHSAAETVGFATPAYKNSQHLDEFPIHDQITINPEVFSPDNDGHDDVMNISYLLDEPGYIVNITIFDGKGRQIRRIANNDLLGTQGTYSWDGVNDEGQKAKIGIHVIYIELFNLHGEVEKYKKVCVVGGSFN